MNEPTIDAGIEQLLLDGKLDFNGKSMFRASPELQELQQRYLQNKAEKQSMTVTTSCFAMACPILPLGFLSMFFVLGKLDGFDKSPEMLAQEKGDLRNEMARMAAADALLRQKKERGEDVESKALLRYASREMAVQPIRSAIRPIKGTDKRVLPRQQSREALADNGFFQTKEKQDKMRKIKQQKILLETLAQKEREEQNTVEASSLSQKLEILDKLLKKMAD